MMTAAREAADFGKTFPPSQSLSAMLVLTTEEQMYSMIINNDRSNDLTAKLAQDPLISGCDH